MKKLFKKAYHYCADKAASVGKAVLAVGTVTVVSIQNVSAAVSATVTTALSDAATDVGTIGAAVLVAIVAAAAFKYMRRSL